MDHNPMEYVQTRCGKIHGVSGEGYTVFRGIPYAAPPVGEKRWKLPEKCEPWEGILEADTFGNRCIQLENDVPLYQKEFYGNHFYDTPDSENCLYLNIWTPAGSADEKLPVAFWIHGGAFLGGWGNEISIDGEAFCRNQVILVTVNYRLNVFGFLAHPWLSAENAQKISGNYGIFDQIAALGWVRENISAFGGDPERITVCGQSAGAMSVQTLISTPLTQNWISGAIMQSGGTYGEGMYRDLSQEEAEDFGVRYVESLKVKNLQELRSLPASQLLEGLIPFLPEMFSEQGGMILAPITDGCLLPYDCYQAVEKDAIKHIPYLLGSNRDDMYVSEEEARTKSGGALHRGSVAFSHMLEKHHRLPAYVYLFSRSLPGDNSGAFHSAELWYTFGTLNRCWRPMTEQDRQLSERMSKAWAAFIKTGCPDIEAEEQWRPCSIKDPYVRIFDVE